MSDTPDQLKYLEPAFEKLKSFDDEDLGDDNPDAMDIVEAALRTRLKSMTGDEALQTIEADADLLGEWIDSDTAPDTADYIHGVLMGITMFADAEDMQRLTE